MCKNKQQDVFGKPVVGSCSRRSLSTHAQCRRYIQDALSLCGKVDSKMSDRAKVNHIIKGIADDAFQLIVINDCFTVEDVVTECRWFEQARSNQITQNFCRLPNTSATSSCESHVSETARFGPTSEDITKIVRRELGAALHLTLATVPLSVVQSIIRREYVNLGMSTCPTTGPKHHFSFVGPITAPVFVPRPQRDLIAWKTPDDRFIFFNCEAVGHIARYCNTLWNNRPRYQPGSRGTCRFDENYISTWLARVNHRSTSLTFRRMTSGFPLPITDPPRRPCLPHPFLHPAVVARLRKTAPSRGDVASLRSISIPYPHSNIQTSNLLRLCVNGASPYALIDTCAAISTMCENLQQKIRKVMALQTQRLSAELTERLYMSFGYVVLK